MMARARVLDNHDMHRFLWLAGGDTRRLKLALVFLMVLPGFPIVYYGTEVGLSQRDGPAGKDAYAREPMLWGDQQRVDILEHVRWLIARRKERVSLRRGQVARVPVTLTSGVDQQVGALARWTEREATVVVFNNGEIPAQYMIEQRHLPFSSGAATPSAGAWLLTPDGITALGETGVNGLRSSSSLSGTLPPLSATMIFW
jgi:glycosidase